MNGTLDHPLEDYVVETWDLFRSELGMAEPPVSDEPDPVAAWGRALGGRDEIILGRVRDWLRGAEESAREDRAQAEALLDRCALPSDDRERLLGRLLRTVAGLSATIRNERPRSADPLTFRIDWRQDGDGHGYWEGPAPTPAFSLIEAVSDLADLHGRFEGAARDGVARRIVQDVRTGELVLPLLARAEGSTEAATLLRALPPGDPKDRGLLLPERTPPAEDEAALEELAPRVAGVYQEAQLLAARENMEPLPPDWPSAKEDRTRPLPGLRAAARVAEGDEPPAEDAMTRQIRELCGALQRKAAVPARSACTYLAVPLSVIDRKTANPELRERARSCLRVLQHLVT